MLQLESQHNPSYVSTATYYPQDFGSIFVHNLGHGMDARPDDGCREGDWATTTCGCHEQRPWLIYPLSTRASPERLVVLALVPPPLLPLPSSPLLNDAPHHIQSSIEYTTYNMHIYLKRWTQAHTRIIPISTRSNFHGADPLISRSWSRFHYTPVGASPPVA